MDVRRLVSVIWIVACMAACGGSGSSGFDAISESAAIGRALDSNRCIARAGLVICPSGKASPRRSPEEPPIVISVALDLSEPLDCRLTADADACAVEVPLIVGGLPVDGELRLATRVVDRIVRWSVGAAFRLPPSRTRVTGTARFALAPATPPGADVEVQIGVLAFRAPAVEVPTGVDELADSGADVVFVTRSFRVAVVEATGAALRDAGDGGGD